DDNAFIESLFRHLKYVPRFPSRGFANLSAARAWVKDFVHWYNQRHLHSAIGYVTPDDRHHGRDLAILAARKQLYAAEQQKNPRRWSGSVRKWHRPGIVTLNPERAVTIQPMTASKVA
ncbi:MAG: integrase core domain-containing protein, partial [Polyangiales bacterium]